MLSQKTIDIVKSTAPILDEHGVTLTEHFYRRMFAHDPEVRPYFNPANQVTGKQPRALAAAVTAYAHHIDDLGALTGAVEIMAQKHAALMITPEQYPIVGRNLLASIKEVLGDGATDEVIEAWGEAYGALADILTSREEAIYAENENEPGGWRGFKPFRVERIVSESEEVRSFFLVPNDGATVPSYEAGQYVTVRVPYAPTGTQMRNYSLSDRPGGEALRISVKKEPPAVADAPGGHVSAFLHDEVREGDTIDLGPPCGAFTLADDLSSERPLVFLAGGVGITVLLSMIKTALRADPARRVVLLYGARNLAVRSFGDELSGLAAQHDGFTMHTRLSEPGATDLTGLGAVSMGLIDDALLDSFTPIGTPSYYFCGPQPFMLATRDLLRRRGVPDTDIRYEFYGPLQTI